MHRNKGRRGLFWIALCLLIMLNACAEKTAAERKIKDLDFTVMTERDLPEQLHKIVNEKKVNPFKLTYSDAEFLYIAQGFGAQQSGGYSVAVKEVYLTENAVYFSTELIGPKEGETVSQTISYPYVVVKLELLDRSVVFE